MNDELYSCDYDIQIHSHMFPRSLVDDGMRQS